MFLETRNEERMRGAKPKSLDTIATEATVVTQNVIRLSSYGILTDINVDIGVAQRLPHVVSVVEKAAEETVTIYCIPTPEAPWKVSVRRPNCLPSTKGHARRGWSDSRVRGRSKNELQEANKSWSTMEATSPGLGSSHRPNQQALMLSAKNDSHLNLLKMIAEQHH
ncbi:hypothetical protein S7711_10547 [Stachybotrys chartarum IBT 7711]|uniref:Uncharacterized protein n=1 Tax=Stachybotrys chartarum (strain CBS 109288 / IBT 7711) TaxID=1280523 RepID=A0A084ARI5_STACB|nr:hypothetical protein S7711_10547 [Stachybotrys chartarum IBT 7711]KFA48082.1 hypothetical protein S40293_10639 [Stachybotrys chartarum IBT 40293]